MPMTEVISLAMSECFSGSMMGMPPPTLASKRHFPVLVAAARSMTSSPHVAMSALLAVTTFLPARRAPQHHVARNGGAADQLDDDVDVRVVQMMSSA